MSKPPTWQIWLRPPVDAKDPQGVHRLRMALKCLLRSFGLTCTNISKIAAEDSAADGNTEVQP